jgi:hypothetical protein
MKCCCVDHEAKGHAKFLITGDYGRDAKSKGGKGAMKAAGLSLDLKSLWNRVQDSAIRASQGGCYISTALYWGGHISKATGVWVGRNRLGES